MLTKATKTNSTWSSICTRIEASHTLPRKGRDLTRMDPMMLNFHHSIAKITVLSSKGEISSSIMQQNSRLPNKAQFLVSLATCLLAVLSASIHVPDPPRVLSYHILQTPCQKPRHPSWMANLEICRTINKCRMAGFPLNQTMLKVDTSTAPPVRPEVHRKAAPTLSID